MMNMHIVLLLEDATFKPLLGGPLGGPEKLAKWMVFKEGIVKFGEGFFNIFHRQLFKGWLGFFPLFYKGAEGFFNIFHSRGEGFFHTFHSFSKGG